MFVTTVNAFVVLVKGGRNLDGGFKQVGVHGFVRQGLLQNTLRVIWHLHR